MQKQEEEPFAIQEEVVEKIHWKREKIPLRYLIVGASFAAIFLIVFLSFFSLFKTKSVEIVRKEPVEKIKEALAPFHGVQFSFNPGSGKLFLVGHVETAVNHQEMQFRIQEINFVTSAEDTVIIDELVVKMMNEILQDNPLWRSVNLQSPSVGKFSVFGYLETNDEAALLSDYLNLNFPYLDRLTNKVVVQENLVAETTALLANQGFSSLSVQITNGEVILTGNYSEKMKSEYSRTLKALNQLNGITGIKNYAVATHPNQAAINISDQYAVSGLSEFDGQGYSAVLNGKIYTLGDTIGGMKITTIEQNTILLEKDGIKYKINYTL